MRNTKTEYVSCPSCGRTLFDLQEVTEQIRTQTGHLPGVSIAVMGCIVNGPGEMADADFGCAALLVSLSRKDLRQHDRLLGGCDSPTAFSAILSKVSLGAKPLSVLRSAGLAESSCKQSKRVIFS